MDNVDTIDRNNYGISLAKKTKNPTKWTVVAKIDMGILKTSLP